MTATCAKETAEYTYPNIADRGGGRRIWAVSGRRCGINAPFGATEGLHILYVLRNLLGGEGSAAIMGAAKSCPGAERTPHAGSG